jgi:hypothetical protein
MIPVFERANTIHALDRAATMIDYSYQYLLTYLRNWALPGNMPIVQPFRKFPAILRAIQMVPKTQNGGFLKND